jgi:flagellar motility protein MotE (MotC chaperone)
MLLSLAPLALALYLFAAQQPLPAAWGAEGRVARPLDDAASLEIKRQQLVEREAALKAKEDALRRLSATLDARVVELNAARKGIEASLVAKKKLDEERYKKMIKIYKGLKSEEAGSLLNKLDDKMAIEMLNQMDQKTIIKLIPFITQPRVLEWTRLNAAVK